MKTLREAELFLENKALRLELARARRALGSSPSIIDTHDLPPPEIVTVPAFPGRKMYVAGTLDAGVDNFGVHVALRCIPSKGDQLELRYFVDEMMVTHVRDAADVVSHLHDKVVMEFAHALRARSFK